MTYILEADLNARLSSETMRAIYDDDNSGATDAANITRLIADAESYVEGFLRVAYDLTVIRALTTGAPNEIKRLCLDVAVAYAVDRWPSYVRANGSALLERARRDLMDLRDGKTRLDIVASPEPPANQGGIVRSGDPDDTDLVAPLFVNGLGDF